MLRGVAGGDEAATAITSLTGDVTGTGPGAAATTLATAQPAVHTWALLQTFTSGVQLGATGLVSWGITSSFPAFKRTTTIVQTRLGDDSGFASIQGKLTTDANATTGLIAGALAALTTASITITDASGQVYRVPCVI